MIPPSASMQHALQRHREVLIDFERDYRRSYASVQQALDRRNLLGSVKIDIENYKAQHGGDADALLAERTRLDNSHRMLDGTLECVAWAPRATVDQVAYLLCVRMDRQPSICNTRRSRIAAHHAERHGGADVGHGEPSAWPQQRDPPHQPPTATRSDHHGLCHWIVHRSSPHVSHAVIEAMHADAWSKESVCRPPPRWPSLSAGRVALAARSRQAQAQAPFPGDTLGMWLRRVHTVLCLCASFGDSGAREEED